jgi:hypothetical protein
MKKATAMFILAFCFIAHAYAGEAYNDEMSDLAFSPAADPSAVYNIPSPYYPRPDDSPGIIVGTTRYDKQTNGTVGIRIARHECGTHIAWMNGITSWNSDRWIYYNFIDPDGNLGWAEGVQVSEVQGAGYTQLDIDSDGRALIVFHNYYNLLLTLATDAGCGMGMFTLHDVPNQFPGQYDFYWPYINYDNSGNIQVTACENAPNAGDPQWFGHTISTDSEASWTDLEIVDSLMCISEIPVSSPVDNKVALVYTRPIVVEGQLMQIVNDVCYIESEDGITWNYAETVNVTNYDYLTDSVFAYTDLAACYDYNGDLHILWNAPAYWIPQGIYMEDSCLLFHWSENTGINLVYNAWHNSYPGSWNRSASKMSISCDRYNNLFALWTNFNDWDVSAIGFSNGELYFSYSSDGGATWSEAENLTNTPTPACTTGACDCEHYATMARYVDDSIYITYIEDKDPGRVSGGEGRETVNPVRYYVIENPLWPTSVEDEETTPKVFELLQNFPNPFNASTNIEFELKGNAPIRLEIFNIHGERVSTLAEGVHSAGKHTVTWDASGMASGIYFYRLTANGRAETRPMVMIK